jgi:hypothetical protein
MIIESHVVSRNVVDSGNSRDSSHITVDFISILIRLANQYESAEEANARNRDSPVGKSDPTKDPEFQKVIRHFVTTPPKPHSEMKIGKRKARASTKPSPGVPSGAGKSKRRSK